MEDIYDIHHALIKEESTIKGFPFRCASELEIRIGTLEYCPNRVNRENFRSGVSEADFYCLMSLIPKDVVEEELWDYSYNTAHSKTKTRVSYNTKREIVSCICKTWMKDVKIEQCVARYDARLNLCREIKAAVPLQGRAYVRHKKRVSVFMCQGRWRLDMTRILQVNRPTYYEIEIEAVSIKPFLKNAQLLKSDIEACFNKLKECLSKQQTKYMYNNNHHFTNFV